MGEKEMNFVCYECGLDFMSEETLNCHTLFLHFSWRGYCTNPNSKTYFDEHSKILRDLKNRYGTSQRRRSSGKMTALDMRLLRRYLDIGYKVPYFLHYIIKEIESDPFYWRCDPYMGYSETSLEKQKNHTDRILKEEEKMKRYAKEYDKELEKE